jgi:hypothetical protein
VEDTSVSGQAADAFLDTRAAGSLMNTNGVPVLWEYRMASAILLPWTSPAEPPATVKS